MKETVIRNSVELTIRGGLPNFFKKLEHSEPVKIAYLGGSISEQGGWRVQSLDYFKKLYPKANISEINATMGGTGSDLGVFRIDYEVLKNKPDLLFVEFAVNDADASPELITRSMEGIVRKTLKNAPGCDICFIYTLTEEDIPSLQEGKMKRSESVMETVADYYNIPSISFGPEVARLQKEGKLIMKVPDAKMTQVAGDALNDSSNIPKNSDGKIVFSLDGVHPIPETGHVIYTQILKKSMEQIQKSSGTGMNLNIPPMRKDNFETCKMYPLDKANFFGSGIIKYKLDEPPGRAFDSKTPGRWRFEPACGISFKFKGTKASIFDQFAMDSGFIEITIDGKTTKIPRFDAYTAYRRMSTVTIGENLPDSIHDVKITVLPDKLDKITILFPENKHDLEKNPAKYDGANWYPSAILTDGELIK